MNKVTSIAAACLALAGAAATAEEAKAEGWTANATVRTIAPSDDSEAQGQGVWATFTFTEASPTLPAGCTNQTYRLWSRSTAGRSENIRQILSILMAAHLSGRPVHLYVGDICSPQGNPYIYGAALL